MPRKFTIRIFDLPVTRSILLLIFLFSFHYSHLVCGVAVVNLAIIKLPKTRKKSDFFCYCWFFSSDFSKPYRCWCWCGVDNNRCQFLTFVSRSLFIDLLRKSTQHVDCIRRIDSKCEWMVQLGLTLCLLFFVVFIPYRLYWSLWIVLLVLFKRNYQWNLDDSWSWEWKLFR